MQATIHLVLNFKWAELYLRNFKRKINIHGYYLSQPHVLVDYTFECLVVNSLKNECDVEIESNLLIVQSYKYDHVT